MAHLAMSAARASKVQAWNGMQWVGIGVVGGLAEPAWNPTLAFDNTGQAVAVWLGGDPELSTLRWSWSNGTVWSPAATLVSGKMVRFPTACRLADGRVMVVWAELDDGFWALKMAMWDAVALAWGPTETIVDQQALIDRPAIAVAADGRVTVAFHGRSYYDDMFAYTRDFSTPGATWMPEQDLTGTAFVEWFPALAYDSDGNLIIRYVSQDIYGSGDTTAPLFPIDSGIAAGLQGSTLSLHPTCLPSMAA